MTIIGFFALLGLPYTFKFLWSPMMDRYVPPILDRRRGWLLICQIFLAASISVMAFLKPVDQIYWVAITAFIIAFISASQDIAVDAYRRDILSNNELALGSSFAVNGYRIGMWVATAGALLIADKLDWKNSYLCMAGIIVLLIPVTVLAPKINMGFDPPQSIKEAVFLPFKDYFLRDHAIGILVFILLFKIGDQMASDMLNPFYLDIGFNKTEIAWVSKTFALVATIAGGFIGGLAVLKFGTYGPLWVSGILQAVSTLGFSVLAKCGPNLPALASVVTFENLTSGMGTAVYVGYMAGLCNKRFTATQYALLSSLMGVPRVIMGSGSGYLAKHMGWVYYFTFCTLIAIPGLLLLLKIKKWQKYLSTN